MSAAYHVGNILRTAHGMYTLGKYAYKFSRWGYKKLAVRRTKSGKWVIPKTKNLRGYKAGKGQTKLNLRGSTGPRQENPMKGKGPYANVIWPKVSTQTRTTYRPTNTNKVKRLKTTTFNHFKAYFKRYKPYLKV